MRALARRVDKVLNGINCIQQGNLDARIDLQDRNREDEISRIAYSFNQMCDDLQLNIEKTVLAQTAQKNAELESLQAKINPHFIYNTLEAIRMKAVEESGSETASMIYLFALMFRNLFKGEMFVRLENEIDNCRIYIDLFSIRYINAFQVKYDISDAALQCIVPRNMLQPVIENCFIHGYNQNNSSNVISISCKIMNEVVIFTVSDNGNGIPDDILESLRRKFKNWKHKDSSSVGLVNVNERLKLIFGEQFGVEINSNSNGTDVKLSFPTVYSNL
jgi:two-component system sensor histidine kinase YesM